MNPDQLPLVLISHTLPDSWLGLLSGSCRIIGGPPTTDRLVPELENQLPNAVGLLTLLTIRVDDRLLDRAPQLRVVSNMAVGVDNIDLNACTRRGIPVGHTPGVLTDGTADLAMALLLASARRLHESSQDARQGNWTSWAPTGWLGADLQGARLGIVGMGKIGCAVARRAVGFGMHLVYTNPRPVTNIEYDLGAVFLSLNELLEQSDFVSLHLPLNADTHHLIGPEALRRMKPTAILINTARGSIVDSSALVQALQEGWISAAALDVTDPEPLPPDHILYSLPNCLITPHIGSATHNTRKRMAELACQNLLAGLSGQPLLHCANPGVYHK